MRRFFLSIAGGRRRPPYVLVNPPQQLVAEQQPPQRGAAAAVLLPPNHGTVGCHGVVGCRCYATPGLVVPPSPSNEAASCASSSVQPSGSETKTKIDHQGGELGTRGLPGSETAPPAPPLRGPGRETPPLLDAKGERTGGFEPMDHTAFAVDTKDLFRGSTPQKCFTRLAGDSKVVLFDNPHRKQLREVVTKSIDLNARFYLTGPQGVGKSHNLALLVGELREQGHVVLYCDSLENWIARPESYLKGMLHTALEVAVKVAAAKGGEAEKSVKVADAQGGADLSDAEFFRDRLRSLEMVWGKKFRRSFRMLKEGCERRKKKVVLVADQDNQLWKAMTHGDAQNKAHAAKVQHMIASCFDVTVLSASVNNEGLAAPRSSYTVLLQLPVPMPPALLPFILGSVESATAYMEALLPQANSVCVAEFEKAPPVGRVGDAGGEHQPLDPAPAAPATTRVALGDAEGGVERVTQSEGGESRGKMKQFSPAEVDQIRNETWLLPYEVHLLGKAWVAVQQDQRVPNSDLLSRACLEYKTRRYDQVPERIEDTLNFGSTKWQKVVSAALSPIDAVSDLGIFGVTAEFDRRFLFLRSARHRLQFLSPAARSIYETQFQKWLQTQPTGPPHWSASLPKEGILIPCRAPPKLSVAEVFAGGYAPMDHRVIVVAKQDYFITKEQPRFAADDHLVLFDNEHRKGLRDTITGTRSPARFYLTGPQGVGKSHNLVLLVRDLRQQGHAVLYCDQAVSWMAFRENYVKQMLDAAMTERYVGQTLIEAVGPLEWNPKASPDEKRDVLHGHLEVIAFHCASYNKKLVLVLDQDNQLWKAKTEPDPLLRPLAERIDNFIMAAPFYLSVLCASANSEGYRRRRECTVLEQLPVPIPAELVPVAMGIPESVEHFMLWLRGKAPEAPKASQTSTTEANKDFPATEIRLPANTVEPVVAAAGVQSAEHDISQEAHAEKRNATLPPMRVLSLTPAALHQIQKATWLLPFEVNSLGEELVIVNKDTPFLPDLELLDNAVNRYEKKRYERVAATVDRHLRNSNHFDESKWYEVAADALSPAGVVSHVKGATDYDRQFIVQDAASRLQFLCPAARKVYALNLRQWLRTQPKPIPFCYGYWYEEKFPELLDHGVDPLYMSDPRRTSPSRPYALEKRIVRNHKELLLDLRDDGPTPRGTPKTDSHTRTYYFFTDKDQPAVDFVAVDVFRYVFYPSTVGRIICGNMCGRVHSDVLDTFAEILGRPLKQKFKDAELSFLWVSHQQDESRDAASREAEASGSKIEDWKQMNAGEPMLQLYRGTSPAFACELTAFVPVAGWAPLRTERARLKLVSRPSTSLLSDAVKKLPLVELFFSCSAGTILSVLKVSKFATFYQLKGQVYRVAAAYDDVGAFSEAIAMRHGFLAGCVEVYPPGTTPNSGVTKRLDADVVLSPSTKERPYVIEVRPS